MLSILLIMIAIAVEKVLTDKF